MLTKRNHHFFASSTAEWRTNESLTALIESMKRSGALFAVWYIPLPENATYPIEEYRPQVKGAVFLQRVDPSESRWESDTISAPELIHVRLSLSRDQALFVNGDALVTLEEDRYSDNPPSDVGSNLARLLGVKLHTVMMDDPDHAEWDWGEVYTLAQEKLQCQKKN